jgi:hypothetical protein
LTYVLNEGIRRQLFASVTKGAVTYEHRKIGAEKPHAARDFRGLSESKHHLIWRPSASATPLSRVHENGILIVRPDRFLPLSRVGELDSQ